MSKPIEIIESILTKNQDSKDENLQNTNRLTVRNPILCRRVSVELSVQQCYNDTKDRELYSDDNDDVNENKNYFKNTSKKNLVDEYGSLSDSETETFKKFKKMRYTSNSTANETLNINTSRRNIYESNNDISENSSLNNIHLNFNQTQNYTYNSNNFKQLNNINLSNNNVLDVITNKEGRITRHLSEGNFDKIINFQSKKKNKKLGRSSNIVNKLDNKRNERLSLRSTKSGYLNINQKTNKNQKLKQTIFQKYDSEKCISNENFDVKKYSSYRKNSIKKFKSNSYVDKFELDENFKLSTDNDDSEYEVDDFKNEKLFSLKTHLFSEINDNLNEQTEDLILFESIERTVLITNERNLDDNDGDEFAYLKNAYEFKRAKLFVPTIIRGPYCNGCEIRYHKIGIDGLIENLDYNDLKDDNFSHENDDIIVAHIVNSIENDHSFQITIMTEIESLPGNADIINNRIGILKKLANYTILPENTMECIPENNVKIMHEKEIHINAEKKIIDKCLEENYINIKDVLSSVIDLVVLKQETEDVLINNETLLKALNEKPDYLIQSFNKIQKNENIEFEKKLDLEKHLNEKIQISEILAFLCENAIYNSKLNNIENKFIELKDKSLEVLDEPLIVDDNLEQLQNENCLVENGVNKINEDLININNYSCEENIEQNNNNNNNINSNNKHFSLVFDTPLNDSMKITEFSNATEMKNFNENNLALLNVSIEKSKGFLFEENKEKKDILNFITDDDNQPTKINLNENQNSKKIEINVNLLNLNVNDYVNENILLSDENHENEDLVINLNLNFANIPGLRIVKTSQRQNSENTQFSFVCEYNVSNSNSSTEPKLSNQLNHNIINENIITKTEIRNPEKENYYDDANMTNFDDIQAEIPEDELVIEENNKIIKNEPFDNDSEIDSSLDDNIFTIDKNIENDIEEFFSQDKEKMDDIFYDDNRNDKIDDGTIENQYAIDYKQSEERKPRPSYLIEKNTHIFGGCLDEEEDDEFFISSGAVYQSWPYIYEPGFKLIPIIEIDEINHVLSKSDNLVYGNYNNDNESKNNINENYDEINDDNELTDYELPSYSLRNYGINFMHIDEKKNKKKKRKRVKSRSIDNLQTTKNECYDLSSSSILAESESDNDLYTSSDSDDDSESIREYKQRHAIGFNRNLNTIALNGRVNKVCSHLDLLYENQNVINSYDELNNSDDKIIGDNTKNKYFSQRFTRLNNSFADKNSFQNKKALFFSEKQLDGYRHRMSYKQIMA